MGKRNKKRTIYAIIFSVMFFCLVMIVFLLLFQVRKIEVTGNQYITNQEVVEWVQADELATNSVYILCKFHFTDYELPEVVEAVKITMKTPWSIKVKVTEKKMAGYIIQGDNYVYFDQDGTVLEKSRELREGFSCIEGMAVSDAVLYKKLPVAKGDKKVFQAFLEMSSVLNALEEKPDQLICQDGVLYLYYGETCVNLGDSNFAKRIAQVPPILEKLGDKKGTLHLENYRDSSATVSFEKNVLPNDEKEAQDKKAKEDKSE